MAKVVLQTISRLGMAAAALSLPFFSVTVAAQINNDGWQDLETLIPQGLTASENPRVDDGWQDLEDFIAPDTATPPAPTADDGWRDLDEYEGTSSSLPNRAQPILSSDGWQNIEDFVPTDDFAQPANSDWFDIEDGFAAPSEQTDAANASLGSGDLIDISVANSDSLSGAYRISTLGTVVMPLIGSVDVAGLNPDALAATLEQLYGVDYLVNPDISVTARDNTFSNDQTTFNTDQTTSLASREDAVSYITAAEPPAAYPSDVLSSGDLIDISVTNSESLGGAYKISTIGTLVMPLIGSVDVAGLSTAALEDRLEQLYEVDYLVDPEITVIARDTIIADIIADDSFAEPAAEPVNLEDSVSYFASPAPSENSPSQFLASGDLVEISVANSDHLNGAYRISSSGTLVLPIIGAVDAAGFTPDILEAVLEQRYSAEYLSASDVTVTASEKIIGQVNFEGLIGRAGPVPITSADTFSSLLAKAGGVSGTRSDLDAVILRSANNKVSARRVSLEDIALSNSFAPVILPGDQVKILGRRALPQVQEDSGKYPLLDKVLSGGALRDF